MMKMDDTDFDALCDGAPPAEAKRLRKLLADWCNGDEQSFPVQLALLTRAQWRAAAAVPRLINEARELMERKLAEHRHQTAALIKGFADTADGKAKALQDIVVRNTETTKKAVTEMRSQSSNAEFVAQSIKEELERGAMQWKQAKADFEAERQKFEQARKELETRQNWRDWLWLVLIVAGMIGIGITIGLHIAR